MKSSSNIVLQHALVSREQRQVLNGHKSTIIWFTGLSGAGKSTLAHAVEKRLFEVGCRTYVLDGDNVRHSLSADLGFSDAARTENIRRIGEVAKLFIEAGVIALTAFISPFQSDRKKVRDLVSDGDFLEVYCYCPLEVCESRDVKGLYRRVRTGEVKEFTGISSPYEAPVSPELTINTSTHTLEESVDLVMTMLATRGILRL